LLLKIYKCAGIVPLITAISFSVPGCSQTNQNTDTVLYWNQAQRLTFDDFQGKPGEADTALYRSSATMLTHKLGAIVKSIDVHLVTEKRKTSFIIHAAMLKNKSWIKNTGDTISLKHEQGHFDICEIHARMLRRDIVKARSIAEARQMFEASAAKEELEQDEYDKVNTFEAGGITSEWSNKIFAALTQLKQYTNAAIVLPIDR
jgi:hypothetical protein